MKAEKCEFEKEEIKFLGMIIGYGKMCMDPENQGSSRMARTKE